MEKVKEVPYGVADFVTVMEQNLYYVDKTMFIPELEKQPRNLFFIRPRRFGKSIFLSMLHSYYDCNQSAKFHSLFGNLWIGQHPTELQGKYQVLFLDFSQVSGNIDSLERNFDFYCSVKLDGFMRRYLIPRRRERRCARLSMPWISWLLFMMRLRRRDFLFI